MTLCGWDPSDGFSSLREKRHLRACCDLSLCHLKTPDDGPLQVQREPTLETKLVCTWPLDFQPPNCENTHFCYLSHPMYSILLWQPELPRGRSFPFLYSLPDSIKTEGFKAGKKGSEDSIPNLHLHPLPCLGIILSLFFRLKRPLSTSFNPSLHVAGF